MADPDGRSKSVSDRVAVKFRHEPTVPNGPSPLRKRVRRRRPVAHQRFNLHQQIVQPAFSQLNVPVHPVPVGKLPLHHPGLQLPDVHELGGQKEFVPIQNQEEL